MMDFLQSIEVSLGNTTAVHTAVAPGLVDDAHRLANEFSTTLTADPEDNSQVRTRFIEFCRQRGATDSSAAALAAALDTSSPHNSLAIFGDALRSGGGSQCL
ncbi:hypothetical protein GGI10_005978, partial [Coemansia sp. RSA 2530]